MKVQDLKPGDVMIFTPNGNEFTIKTVTEKRIHWWLGFITKSGWGRNNMRTAGTSTRLFQKGIDKGIYIKK